MAQPTISPQIMRFWKNMPYSLGTSSRMWSNWNSDAYQNDMTRIALTDRNLWKGLKGASLSSVAM